MRDNFIQNTTIKSYDGITLAIVNYNVEIFCDALFYCNNILCPENIRRSVPKRRAEYFAGRLSAQRALSLYGYENFHVKSQVTGSPIWPYGINGSIAHSRDYAVALLSSNANISYVGIDVESIVNRDVADAVKRYALHENEVEMLQKSEMIYEKAVTLFFSIKESFFKSVSEYMMAPFSIYDINIISLDEKDNYCVVHVAPEKSPAWYQLPMLKVYFWFADGDTVISYVLSDRG
ncbi:MULTISPECIES: 4'-phosphopantetheinyl transferase family protein [Enterobacter cloacae complex]|uniref:4'-phosphopantetheinyl transferase family protein n=1 Tax=Enterobacter cloacae complex TaxID=354276 RepID=UPI00079A3E17|nr:4'-phosphopantetheinyl transferase superfamily protein [Enterobacter ludwigii]WNI43110.1 4'-phosphopantetheinyl transferase superfamily protein [Enterobacter ludwigii]WNI52141.1 4'-phosphopantetheinyl transferase superfamily protein [Enterobacter ludwigii]WNI83937.1 4'-phosphopantetheinyl transferase superfamily protein [Enterobacter ludwigii]SAC79580.1 4'-phosphopantetheinyl transferase entD [Enterobacter ludwigii]